MSIFKAIILGLVQGLSEFLPVSSSGHLQLAGYFLHIDEVPLLFSIWLHIATLAAVCAVFWKRITRLFVVFVKIIARKTSEEDSADVRMIVALIIGTLVTGVIGILIKDYVEAIDVRVVAGCLVLTGLFLLAGDKFARNTEIKNGNVQWWHGAIVGFMQGIAVIPGISRSGTTISTARLFGVSRKEAGEFSFLLSIPAILAAFMLELISADTLAGTVPTISLIAGLISAFISGALSLKMLLKLVNQGKLSVFAYYLIPVGTLLLFYFSMQ